MEDRAIPAADFGFAQTFGASQIDYGLGVTTDAFGNVYMAGQFSGDVDFDPGPGTSILSSAGHDVVVAKYAPNGVLVWARGMGSGVASPSDIAVDALGNVYTTGSYSADADFDPGPGTATLQDAGDGSLFVSKLDADGNFVWARGVTGTLYTQGAAIAVGVDGAVYTAGRFNGSKDFDPGPGTFVLTPTGTFNWDGFVLKLDASGNFVWARNLGGTGWDEVDGLAVNSSGVFTTGRFNGTADFDPGPGMFSLTSVSDPDMFVSKLDLDGSFAWAVGVGGPGAYVWGYDLALDAMGNIYTTGPIAGTADFDPGPATYNVISLLFTNPAEGSSADAFVSKLDGNGQFVWARKMGGRESEGGNAIAVDGDGNVYTTGFFESTADFDPGLAATRFTVPPAGTDNAYVSKLDSFGDFVWARQLVRGGDGRAYDIAVSADGDVYSVGRFSGTADFDPGPGTKLRTDAGVADMYLSQFNQPHGPLSYAAPTGNGADRLILRRRGAQLEVFDARTQRVVSSRPWDEVTGVTVAGADGEDDTLTVDYAGGMFRPPAGITFVGGAAGFDTIRIRGSDTSYTLTDSTLTGSNGILLTLSGVEAAELTGGAGANVLDATSFTGHVALDGRGGNDVLRGALGGSFFAGGTGNDLLDGNGASVTGSGGLGIDTLVAATDADLTLRSLAAGRTELKIVAPNGIVLAAQLLTGIERAALAGGDGDNVLNAATFVGSVSLDGGSGNDRLTGGPTADILVGGNGDDFLSGGRGSDILDGGIGVDTLIEADDAHFTLTQTQLTVTSLAGVPRGTDVLVSIDLATLTGGAGANRINASQFGGAVTLTGGAGNDILVGGTQADVLTGGAGTDSVTGGMGADTFSSVDAVSEYVDFDSAGGDLIL